MRFAVNGQRDTAVSAANPLPTTGSGSSPIVLASNAAMAAGSFQPTAAGTLVARGGDYRWQVIATSFGGGTLSLQALAPDNTTWIAFDPVASLTANGGVNVGIPDGATVRMAMTGGTGGTGVYATLSRISA